MTIRSFNIISYFEYADKEYKKASAEIESQKKEYILGVDEDRYKNYLIARYALEPLHVDIEKEHIEPPAVLKEIRKNHWQENEEVSYYKFTVTYPYTGSKANFKISPSSKSLTGADITVSDTTVAFTFNLYKLDPEEFKRVKQDVQYRAFVNIPNVNSDVARFNRELEDVISRKLTLTKNNYLKENSFFEAINLPINASATFAAPTVKKKIIPQPLVQQGKEYTAEPIITTEMYKDILSVIYTSGKNMETKPSLYKKKDEEGLRDQFIFVLESRYNSTTATGESFNREGKADILLKYAQGSTNVFVAECKFWHGASEFHNGISQLFDRYLTWRDTKTAVMFFVRNKDFSNVLSVIKEEAKKHVYFVKEAGYGGESSFSYIFRLPQDPSKHVFLEIMAFHFDKAI